MKRRTAVDPASSSEIDPNRVAPLEPTSPTCLRLSVASVDPTTSAQTRTVRLPRPSSRPARSVSVASCAAPCVVGAGLTRECVVCWAVWCWCVWRSENCEPMGGGSLCRSEFGTGSQERRRAASGRAAACGKQQQAGFRG